MRNMMCTIPGDQEIQENPYHLWTQKMPLSLIEEAAFSGDSFFLGCGTSD
jgi:hypothetical protein